MAAERVTVMVLKVDLQCPYCYKKVKKILCKFPQIRDQRYDEKANTVTVTVVCCSPEKIRDKLCCKGRKVIKSIEIKEPEKPKEPKKPKEPEKHREPKTEGRPEPPLTNPKEPDKPDLPERPQRPKAAAEKAPQAPKPVPTLLPPVIGCQPDFPMRTCCWQCHEGYGGVPCYHGYGVPPPPPPCYDGYYGYGYGQGRGWHVSSFDYYFSEENPQSCSTM